ncbi:uncharacterized protein TRIADDRAFT_61748 [Trichoplax adhaerens]|uniref:CRAL-TRIO domain-containing protein n=1 Tax=Trichoplax adhaerens TaxID=10228 RepID=B3SBV4_TRIAD|nr:hypothetical protein TRIADDRAFT_61748 [Trichoplax adhaerens]EDV19825.1 hypothetical protein TRIADDRAFT_61748 [Trichoplax adhaerens]|eukprot:XP_002117695.1 hypothetical protein TRIADDRAFT_61748 [Trichoplax adhaerens]
MPYTYFNKMHAIMIELSNTAIRARKFDLAKSEAMLRKSMEFRKEMKLDDLVQSYKIPQIIQDYYAGNYFGYDKEGSPVLVDPIGNLDIKGLMHCVKKEEIWKYKLYMAEIATVKFKQQSKKLGRRIESMTTIEDMSNLGLKHLWKPAPAIFPVMYSLMKPFVSEETKQKIFVLGRYILDLYCASEPEFGYIYVSCKRSHNIYI